MDDKHFPHFELTRSIIGAFFEVYNGLDYGLLESLYSSALDSELRSRGHAVVRELAVDVRYKGKLIGVQKLDMVVDGLVIVELKSTAALHPSFRRQLISYLNAAKMEVGLLLHFGPVPKAHRLFGRDREGRLGSIQ